MTRWMFVPSLVLMVAGIAGGQDKSIPQPPKIEKKVESRPLIDTEAFLREHDRNKDGALSKDEIPEWLGHNFARIDTDKDSRLSKAELDQGIAYLHARRRPSDAVVVMIEMSDFDDAAAEEVQRAYVILLKLDTNKDGKLDDNELKAGRTQFLTERIDGIFKRQDTDKDGKISADEARGMVKENFKPLDQNMDGFIDRNELTAALNYRPADPKTDAKEPPTKK